VVRTIADRAGALAVPVGAVVAGPKGPSVRVVGSGDDRVVPVTLGIVADGWVEVTLGLAAGTKVRLPA
jgi:multidrug efflux pump subunit AcrA (membrane-fusion protein)